VQERRFSSISPTDYKDTKASIFRSEVIGIRVAHDRCAEGKEKLCGNAALELSRSRTASIISVTVCASIVLLVLVVRTEKGNETKRTHTYSLRL